MASEKIPPEVQQLADARAAARRARDWATADDLRRRIEAAGWSIVDAASLYALSPAVAPDVEQGGVVRYGSSRSVPSRLDEAPVGVASVVLVATDWPDDLARSLRALIDHSPDGTQLIVVANAPAEAQARRLGALDAVDPGAPGVVTEVVWTSARLGHAAALNAGIRRAAAPIVIVLDTSVEPAGDLISALVGAMDDPGVGVAGPFGMVSADLRRFEAAPDGVVDVDAIEGDALAFRRADYVARGPLDEQFAFHRSLDVWWSLVLRDPAADTDVPRRAVCVPGVRITRHGHRASAGLSDAQRDRFARRNFYRVLKRFATRHDLLVANSDRGFGP
jgi:cysteinyl-tRNA synthetase